MTFVDGGAARGMGIYYKSLSTMCTKEHKRAEFHRKILRNAQFCGLMTIADGGAARATGIYYNSQSAMHII